MYNNTDIILSILNSVYIVCSVYRSTYPNINSFTNIISNYLQINIT